MTPSASSSLTVSAISTYAPSVNHTQAIPTLKPEPCYLIFSINTASFHLKTFKTITQNFTNNGIHPPPSKFSSPRSKTALNLPRTDNSPSPTSRSSTMLTNLCIALDSILTIAKHGTLNRLPKRPGQTLNHIFYKLNANNDFSKMPPNRVFTVTSSMTNALSLKTVSTNIPPPNIRRYQLLPPTKKPSQM